MDFGLTKKQQYALKFLVTTPTVVEASKSSGISERTLRRWMSDRSFVLALSYAQFESIKETFRALRGLELEAVEALRDCLQNPGKLGANNKLRTANSILELSAKMYERICLDERIQALEKVSTK